MSIDTPVEELSLIEHNALDRGDTEFIFTKAELERMDYNLLRNLAKHANSQEINGKSPKFAMIRYFACQRSLDEYNQ